MGEDEPLPGRDDFAVLLPQQTRWHDDDVYGHVNNVVYYAYFDTAVNAHLMEITGRDIRRLPAIGIVVETSCRYLAPVGFPDRLHVGLAVQRLGRSSVTYRLGLFREDEPRPSAVARFVHVYVDADSRRPVPVPDLVRDGLAYAVDR